MLVTSVDVGTNNLAVVVVEGTPTESESGVCVKLKHAMLVNFDCDTLCDIGVLLTERLKDVVVHEVDEVIVEQQFHGKTKFGGGACANNTKMMNLSHMIVQFFIDTAVRLGRTPNVKFVSAQSKYKLVAFPKGEIRYKVYADAKATRKEVAKKIGKGLIEEYDEDRFAEFLARLEKKDDVCDAYIQARAYVEKKMCKPKFYKQNRTKWDSKTMTLVNAPSNIKPIIISKKRKAMEEDSEVKKSSEEEEEEKPPVKRKVPVMTEEERSEKIRKEWEFLSYDPDNKIFAASKKI
jgi:hypothetical protein